MMRQPAISSQEKRTRGLLQVRRMLPRKRNTFRKPKRLMRLRQNTHTPGHGMCGVGFGTQAQRLTSALRTWNPLAHRARPPLNSSDIRAINRINAAAADYRDQEPR